MEIPVILLNYNSSADCRKCVSFLQTQQGVEIEIIIVDNCSPREGEQFVLQQLCQEQGCTLIVAKENRGYNAGNNIGLRYAAEKGYKYAVIANPDMEFPQTDYFAKMAARMEEDSQIAVLGTDIVSPEGIHQNPMKRDGDWRSSFGWVKGLLCRNKPSDTYDFIDNYKHSHYCSKVGGCCLMVRMESIQEIGYFDEHVFLYCEEAILSRQIERTGKRMYYLAEAQAVHAHVKSEKGDPIKRFKAWRKSRIYFIRHYSGDTWIGRQIAILSTRIYVWMFILAKKLNGANKV